MMMRERMTQDIIENPAFKLMLFLLVGIGSISFFVVETVGKACITIILDTTAGLGWMGGLIAFVSILGIAAILVKAKIES